MIDTRIDVKHKGKDKMVGKVLSDIFLHVEKSPTQHHVVADSPGGIDTVVAHWLRSKGVVLVIHQSPTRAYMTTTDTLIEKSQRRFEDDRDRLFLPTDLWDSCERVSDDWVKTIRVIDWRDLPPEEVEQFMRNMPASTAKTERKLHPSMQPKIEVKNPCPCCGNEVFGPNGEWGMGCACTFVDKGRRCVYHSRSMKAAK